MLSKFFVRTFVKDYTNIENHKVRDAYGYLGGIVGIVVNVILFAIKFAIGLISHSISVTADAVHNLTDATSSVVTIIGFKMASRPADKEHPFGHGRVEYISGLMVSFLVLLVGIEFIKSSYERITNPTVVNFQWTSFIIILLSILVKLWLSRFSRFIGKSIDSSALEASGFEALGDVFTSGCVALSLILSRYTTIPIDGYIGILISLFILFSGYSLIKETLNPLLGEAPDRKLVEKIMHEITKYKYIIGVHDLMIHNYGPRKSLASIHVEVPCYLSLIELTETIAKAEKEISRNLNIYMVIHVDPVKNAQIIKN
ncbi:MAG: cation diffusion facilitator family transporter [Clostridiaceae bacterium]